MRDYSQYKNKPTSDDYHTGNPCIICGDIEGPMSEDCVCGYCMTIISAPSVELPSLLEHTRAWKEYLAIVWSKRATLIINQSWGD